MHEPFCEDLESCSQERVRPSSIVKVGFLFESALVLVALGLGHWLQQSAWQNLLGPTLWKTLQAVGIGLLATAPMLGVLNTQQRVRLSAYRSTTQRNQP